MVTDSVDFSACPGFPDRVITDGGTVYRLEVGPAGGAVKGGPSVVGTLRIEGPPFFGVVIC
jgi:hypothetical protein